MDALRASACPFDAKLDQRKSAAIAARNVVPELPETELVERFARARDVLRSPVALQAGAGAEHVDVGNAEHVPVFYLDGAVHRKRRAAIVPFFTPKAIATRHRAVMERMTDSLIARLRDKGEARLDAISFELTVAVAAEIVGLGDGDMRGLARRISHLLDHSFADPRGLKGLKTRLLQGWYGFRFYTKDVRPAIRARRTERRDDIISQTLDQGYSDKAIVIECMTYATAGMVTTREFIVMVAWHLFDAPELRERYLAADEAGQFAILQEILRLEPIASRIYRRTPPGAGEGALPEDTLFAIDLRTANVDPDAVGECPFAIDPDRTGRQKATGNYLSFGDGSHTCPGAQVALHETRIFIDRLFRVPGIALKRAPDMRWNPMLSSYELRRAIVTCAG